MYFYNVNKTNSFVQELNSAAPVHCLLVQQQFNTKLKVLVILICVFEILQPSNNRKINNGVFLQCCITLSMNLYHTCAIISFL